MSSYLEYALLLIEVSGRPAIWGTLNPNDIDSALLLKFGGQDIALDTFNEDLLPSKKGRRRFVASHPVTAARHFDRVTALLFDTVIGSDQKGAGKGIFGSVFAHYGTIETQGRGSLHIHFLLWLDKQPTEEELLQALKDSDLGPALSAYFDAILQHDFEDCFSEPTETLASAPMLVPPPDVVEDDEVYLQSVNSHRKLVCCLLWLLRHD